MIFIGDFNAPVEVRKGRLAGMGLTPLRTSGSAATYHSNWKPVSAIDFFAVNKYAGPPSYR